MNVSFVFGIEIVRCPNTSLVFACSPDSVNAPPVRANVNAASPNVSFGLAISENGAGVNEATRAVSEKSIAPSEGALPASIASTAPPPRVPVIHIGAAGRTPPAASWPSVPLVPIETCTIKLAPATTAGLPSSLRPSGSPSIAPLPPATTSTVRDTFASPSTAFGIIAPRSNASSLSAAAQPLPALITNSCAPPLASSTRYEPLPTFVTTFPVTLASSGRPARKPFTSSSSSARAGRLASTAIENART